MIKIKDQFHCCGCAACVQACPNKCINLKEDEKGFLYPYVNEIDCVNCGKCDSVCPYLKPNSPRRPIKVYSAFNDDEKIRKLSSSGGLFSIFAENVLNEGGVVFGACFDANWMVKHTYIETEDELFKLRGSKYLQSRIGDTYFQVYRFLKTGRKVLFTGTPCQIAGLKKFLNKNYENLLTVDLICHGVPSSKIWKSYLEKICCDSVKSKQSTLSISDIVSINFRDKALGWSDYRMSIAFNDGTIIVKNINDNLFFQLFLQDLINRKSCSNCPAKSGKSNSDITIGDFWGINKLFPDYSDNKGVSLLLAYTPKGLSYLNNRKIQKIEVLYDAVLPLNDTIVYSPPISDKSELFWNSFNEFGFKYADNFLCHTHINYLEKLIFIVKHCFKKL